MASTPAVHALGIATHGLKREPRMNPPVLRVRIRTVVKPTEDPSKVRRAIESLFPGATIRETADGLEADAEDLSRLRELIRSERIPDTARGAMLAHLSEDGLRTWFLLGKQAAAAGRAHFGPLRSPLGDLEVLMTGTEPHEVERKVYWLAPDTTVDPEWAEIPFSLRPGQDAPPT